jgi:hypothetical protein
MVSQSPSDHSLLGVSSDNPLVTFYDMHGRKGEKLSFCSVPDTTRDLFFHGCRRMSYKASKELTALTPEVDCNQWI